jgi:large repetitive protein
MENSARDERVNRICSIWAAIGRAPGTVAGHRFLALALLIGGCALAGCGGPPAPAFPVQVAVSGIASATGAGTGGPLSGAVALQISATDQAGGITSGTIVFAYDGVTTFSQTGLVAGEDYSIQVITSPVGETCVLQGAAVDPLNLSLQEGVAVNPPILVTVSCAYPPVAISGTVMGLNPGNQLVIQDNGADNDTVSANGPFTFATPIQSGASYAVTVLSQTAAVPQNCTVTNGSGGVGPSAGVMKNIVILCGDSNYNLSATVSGLGPGAALTLFDNNEDFLGFSANGLENFNTTYADGATYSVGFSGAPFGATCTLANASGTVAGPGVNVTITCTATNLYTVSVEVSGLLAGNSVTLQDNGADDLTVTSNTTDAFPAFSTQLPPGSNYAVTVLTEPAGQNCTVFNGSGTNTGPNPPIAVVDCSASSSYNIGVTVSGLLPGATLVLQNNGKDNLTVQGSANGSPVTMNFATPVESSASPYAVTVLTPPSGEGCSVAAGSGSVSTSNVTIAVTCSAQITGIEVIPPSPSAAVGTTQQFKALGLFTEGGVEDLSSQASWSSSDTGVAPINATTGLATIIAPGVSTIQAQVTVAGQPFAATTPLTGTGNGVTLSSIAVSPANASLPVGATQQYSATGLFSNANSVDISPWVTWSVQSAGAASITATGLASGVAAGPATVSASLQPEGQASVSGNTGLTVSAVTVVCPAPPHASPTYCGTVSVTSSYGTVYSGTFYFTLAPPSGGVSSVASCSVTLVPTTPPQTADTISQCLSGDVDSAGNLDLYVGGGNYQLVFMGSVSANGNVGGSVSSPNFISGGGVNPGGTFAGMLQP